jgi:Spy/CpxP family protein refolding chaperone
MGPPSEALEACKGKAEGTVVEFLNRRGDKVAATCRMMPVPEGFGEKGGPGGMKGRMAQELGLSDSQKEKIDALLKAEQEKSAPLRKQIDENREQLRKASLTTPFNETSVRALATKLAQLKTDMMISHARVKSEISALLTPEQRAQAEKLQPPMGRGHGHAGPQCGWND